MNHAFADASVRAADADVLVGSAEAAHGMALEMGQHQKRIVVQKIFAHVHLVKPLASLDGERGDAVLIGDVHRAEIPSVDLQGLPVCFRGVAGAFVIGVGLHDDRFGQTGCQQFLHPWSGNDIGALRLAGVQLDGHLALQHGAYPVVDLLQSLFGQIPGEEHHGAVAGALFKGDVAVAAGPRYGIFLTHILSPSYR